MRLWYIHEINVWSTRSPDTKIHRKRKQCTQCSCKHNSSHKTSTVIIYKCQMFSYYFWCCSVGNLKANRAFWEVGLFVVYFTWDFKEKKAEALKPKTNSKKFSEALQTKLCVKYMSFNVINWVYFECIRSRFAQCPSVNKHFRNVHSLRIYYLKNS